MCKIGLAAPGKFHARGFHPTAPCGTFGAAAAAGKLYGLKPAQWVDAFGICGSQSSGIIEYLADGTWTKRLHPGWSSHAGVVAALLARGGFRGPAAVFEGTHNFYKAFGASDPDLGKLDELGERAQRLRLRDVAGVYDALHARVREELDDAPDVRQVVVGVADDADQQPLGDLLQDVDRARAAEADDVRQAELRVLHLPLRGLAAQMRRHLVDVGDAGGAERMSLR